MKHRFACLFALAFSLVAVADLAAPRDSGKVRRQETGDVERNRHESRLAESTRPRCSSTSRTALRRSIGRSSSKAPSIFSEVDGTAIRSSRETRFTVQGIAARNGGRQAWARSVVLTAGGKEVLEAVTSPSASASRNQPARPAPAGGRRAARLGPPPGETRLLGSAERQRARQVKRNPDGCLRASAQHRGRRQGSALSALGPRFVRTASTQLLKDDPGYLFCIPQAARDEFQSRMRNPVCRRPGPQTHFRVHGWWKSHVPDHIRTGGPSRARFAEMLRYRCIRPGCREMGQGHAGRGRQRIQ